MLIGLTHTVPPGIRECELSFIDRDPIDIKLAQRQHRAYCNALENSGAQVKILSANDAHADACFVEDSAIVLDDLAVITHPGAASRRGETAAIAAELAKYCELVFIQSPATTPATMDGGDVLQIGRRLYVGLSSRTNAAAIEELSRLLAPRGYQVIAVEVSASLHLKTACTAIDAETLLLNPRWVDERLFQGFRILHTAEDEPWAANVVRVEETVLAQAGFPKTRERIAPYCPKVMLLDISEFRKAEAGLSCLSILFHA